MGQGLVWSVFLDGTVLVLGPGSYTTTTSYNPPSNLSLSQYIGIPTNGAAGATLILRGSDLFPDCSLVAVAVGVWQWTPLVCTYTNVTLLTSSGAGGGLPVVVTVGGTSVTLPLSVSYAPPVVTAVFASLLPTYGGGTVRVQGHSFGPAAAAIAVSFGNGTDGHTYTAACARAEPDAVYEWLVCTAPPGVGAGHQWYVCIENQCAFSPNGTSYAPPTISSISGV